MAFDNRFIDDLKSRINILDVIGRDVNLKRAGSNYKGLCPFHNEKTPSFIVSEQKQIFNCFGCGVKGDVIEYVKQRGNMTFMEAVEKLCEDYHIEMPKTSAPRIDYDRYYEINRKAARFYFGCLTGHANPGYAYIRNRGITDETIRKFGLGYAPESWTALYDHLKAEDVSEEDLLKLGLIIQGKEGFYDKFRNRVMFPIFNTQGKVIGFGGRALGDAKPKYLNSNESELFLKKNNLYALNITKGDIASEDQVIVVEGYMDAISLYQSGVKNVAASLGTALTENQGRLLSRYTKNVVLSYDSDAAGIKAAVRGIDVVRNAGCSVRILQVTDGKDPDEFIRKNGREAFLNLVKNAVPAAEFRLDVLKAGYDLTDDMQVLDYIRKCVPVLRSLGPVEQNIYIKKLSGEFGISESSLETEVRTDRDPYIRNEAAERSSHNRQRRENDDSDLRIELSFLILAANNISYLERIQRDEISFRSSLAQKIHKALLSLAEDCGPGEQSVKSQRIYDVLDPEEEAVFRRALESIKIGPDDEIFYVECRAKYRLARYNEMQTELLNRLSVAEKLGNDEEVAEVAAELLRVKDLIRKVKEN